MITYFQMRDMILLKYIFVMAVVFLIFPCSFVKCGKLNKLS